MPKDPLNNQAMKAEENKKPVQDLVREGKKVTGGAASPNETEREENSGLDSSNQAKEEVMPEAESKKEEITGHNELPDQTKVGGE
jgi:hypothetical protein